MKNSKGFKRTFLMLFLLLAVVFTGFTRAVPAQAATKTATKSMTVGKTASYKTSTYSNVTSSKTSVAKVSKKSGKYVVSAKKVGTSTLKLYKKGKLYKKVYLIVTKTSSFTGKTSAVILKAGKTSTFTTKRAKTIRSKTTTSYSSSNKSVASVSSSGKITAKKAGTATITAKMKYKGTTIRKLTKKVTVNGLKSGDLKWGSNASDTLYVGDSENISISTVDKNDTTVRDMWRTAEYTWSCSDTSVLSLKTVGKGGNGNYITAQKAGTATVTCTVQGMTFKRKFTVKPFKSDYSYEIKILNNPEYTLYSSNTETGLGIAGTLIYIKTDNPDYNNLDLETSDDTLWTCGYTFKDVHYTGQIGDISKVEGGYLCVLDYTTPGKKTFAVRESLDSKHVIDVAEISFTIEDGKTAEQKWFKETMNFVTNDAMTDVEKMQALCDYVKYGFKYYPTSNGYSSCDLTTHVGAWWETKEIDCGTAASIMDYFADMLGLERYDDYYDTTGDGVKNHVSMYVIVDGEEYGFDATPPQNSNIISSWDYVI